LFSKPHWAVKTLSQISRNFQQSHLLAFEARAGFRNDYRDVWIVLVHRRTLSTNILMATNFVYTSHMALKMIWPRWVTIRGN